MDDVILGGMIKEAGVFYRIDLEEPGGIKLLIRANLKLSRRFLFYLLVVLPFQWKAQKEPQQRKSLIERWWVHYNTKRPHTSLGYRPPAPEVIMLLKVNVKK